MSTNKTAAKAAAKKRAPKKKDVPKQEPFIRLGDGMYSDPNDDTVVVINPIELLRAKNLPLTQEAAFAVYSTVLKDANERDVAVVLIDEMGLPSELDLLTKHLERGQPIIELPPEDDLQPYEWDGVERRRLPRR